MNQLDRILEVTGRPSSEDIDAIQSPFAATMLDSLPQSDPRPLHHMFPNASPEATDLLSRLLQVRWSQVHRQHQDMGPKTSRGRGLHV